MNAAIYARKSTKDDNAEEAKSVNRQIDAARAFIAAKGWTVEEANIYTDDKTSGALFASREEFQRMMRDAATGTFDVVVFFDLDRFGRHGQKSMEALNALADVGVEVWDYSTGQVVDLDSFEGETSTWLKTRMAQQFRDQIRKATRAAMRRKAELGWHTHGKVFGYDKVRIEKGHCELRINEPEAAVVREIYKRFAAGAGARKIAEALNRAKVPKPRAQQGRRDGWSVSTIRAVLRRPLYRGEVVYGRTAKAYNRELRKVHRHTKREKGQIRRPEESWVKKEVPALRIVDADLAARVDERFNDRRTRYLAAKERNTGEHKTHGRYLLSAGMLLCPTCGGHFEARKYPWRVKEPGGHPGHVYICATRRRKPGVCTNTLALPIADTDDAVLSTIEGEVLGTRFIRELLSLVDHAPDETEWLTAERDRLQTEVQRLIGSIAAGVPADSVAPAIREREDAIRNLEKRINRPRVPRLDQARLLAALEQRAEQWKAELRDEPQIARMVLRRLVGPLTLWDDAVVGKRPDFIKWEAEPKAEILDGLAPTLLVASPTGTVNSCTRKFLGIAA